MTNLFQTGDFKLASGRQSRFKIECDSLTDADWQALAAMASRIVPPFSEAIGVPRGGLVLAEAMKPYATSEGGILLCDDVWTTGGTMSRLRDKLSTERPDARPIFGLVAFARGELRLWASAIFQVNRQLLQA
jgi:orotate phosphoribosyltransferase